MKNKVAVDMNNKLNIPNLTVLAEWLESGAPHKHIKFDMRSWIKLEDSRGFPTRNIKAACGAVCCMAGAAAQFFAGEELKDSCTIGGELFNPRVARGVAQEALGLSPDQVEELFTPFGIVLHTITPQKAGKVVRHLIKTGRVDWRVAGYSRRC